MTKVVFQPPAPYGTSAIRNPQTEIVWLQSAGHYIPALHIQKRGAIYTILYSHGNSEAVGRIATSLYRLADDVCVNILAYEYSGYPWTHHKTPDRPQPDESFFLKVSDITDPSEEYCYANIISAYQYLVNTANIPANRIILFGRSLGSGPTTELALRTNGQSRALIIESGFMSCMRVVMPFSAPFDMFCNVNKIHQVTCPSLYVHGTEDKLIKIKHAKTMYRVSGASHKEYLWIQDASHNDIGSSSKFRNQYIEAIRVFLVHLLNEDFPMNDSKQ